MTARIVQSSSISKAAVHCLCGGSIQVDLDEDGVTLCREFMLLHRTCMELPAADEEVFFVEDDPAGLEDTV